MPPRDDMSGANAPRTVPAIRIVTGSPQDTTRAAIRALVSDPDLFVRDSDLVHVTRATRAEQEESEYAPGQYAIFAGTPKIHTMTLATLRVRMCQFARWERDKRKPDGSFEVVKCEPTRQHAEELRDEKHWPGLRPLTGVLEAPSMRPDGTIIQGEPRYDRATGYLYEPAEHFPAVADAPTIDDARRSYAALAELFADFPFAREEGRAACVSALATLVARPAINGPVPAYLMDATTPGSGKTYLVDVCSAVAYGRESGRSPFPHTTGRDADTELSKVLATIIRRGAQIVNFDNVPPETRVGGAVLEEMITSRTMSFRILGKTEDFTLPVRIVVFATGNNLQWSNDMNRRIMWIRLEPDMEDPEQRPRETYKYPERAGRLVEHATERRAEYVHHVLTMLRAYVVAGRPNKRSLGSFEAWAELIPSAIVWAGGADPMLCRPSQSGVESPDKSYGRLLAREWDAFCRASGMRSATAADVIGALYPKDQGGAPSPQWEELRSAIEHFLPVRASQIPRPIDLGNLITTRFKGAAMRVRPAPDPLHRFAEDGLSHGRRRWKLEPVPERKIGPVPDDDPAERFAR